MEYNQIIQSTILIIALIAASIIDIKSFKIPNTITFGLMLAGIIYNVIFDKPSLLYNISAVVLMFFVGSFGLVGMGDLKILMGITLLCGWQTMLMGLLFACLLCIIVRLVTNRLDVIEALKNLKQSVIGRCTVQTKVKKSPFAPYIAIGTIFSYLMINIFAITEGLF